MACLATLMGSFSLLADVKTVIPVNPMSSSRARMKQVLLPQHWVLKDMLFLVREGVVTGLPSFFFSGGKSWTRGEISILLGKVLDKMERDGADPKREVLESLRRLIKEFQPELGSLNVEQTLGFGDLWKIREQKKKTSSAQEGSEEDWDVFGSSTSSWTHALSTDDGDWKENLNVGVRKGEVKAEATLIAQQEATSPFEVGLREFRLGGRTKGILDKYALTWDRDEEKLGYLKSIFGYTGGSSWSKGLTVGNLNLEGANFLLDINEDERLEWVMGRTQGDNADRLMALHYKKATNENLTWMLQGVGAWYHEASSSGARGLSDETVWGAGLEWSDDRLDAVTEVGFSARGGWGGFAEVQYPISDWGELYWNGRHYDKFEFDYHSPEVYRGISGGDDVNEQGTGLDLDAEFKEKYGLTFSLDSSFGGSAGRLYYGYAELNSEESWADVNVSFEHEWSRLWLNKITTFRLSRSFESGWRTSLDWSRDKVDGEGSHSTRVALYWDAIREVLSFSSSLSNRENSSGRNLTQQFGANWNLTSSQFFSVQTTFSRPDSSDNSAELNYLLKF
jgi:hypothetical protein